MAEAHGVPELVHQHVCKFGVAVSEVTCAVVVIEVCVEHHVDLASNVESDVAENAAPPQRVTVPYRAWREWVFRAVERDGVLPVPEVPAQRCWGAVELKIHPGLADKIVQCPLHGFKAFGFIEDGLVDVEEVAAVAVVVVEVGVAVGAERFRVEVVSDVQGVGRLERVAIVGDDPNTVGLGLRDFDCDGGIAPIRVVEVGCGVRIVIAATGFEGDVAVALASTEPCAGDGQHFHAVAGGPVRAQFDGAAVESHGQDVAL